MIISNPIPKFLVLTTAYFTQLKREVELESITYRTEESGWWNGRGKEIFFMLFMIY